MENNLDVPKSAKRVVIRIDPVPDLKVPNSHEVYDYKEHARHYSPDKDQTAPPKSALKSKRRQSLLIVTTPPLLKNVSSSETAPPHIEDETHAGYRKHTGIERLVEEEEEVIPEHHRVLYELLGSDKAESILNPKMEEPTKTSEVETEQEPRRKLPTVDTCLGADALWGILKKESDRKLYRMDRKIPIDWKTSYGAYIRSNINQSKSLVERSFTHHADVPELDKLLDLRYKGRVQKARHHTNVMYRSSENNKNRTTLLLSNNPVPDYNDRDGNMTLARYFPNQLNTPNTPPSDRSLQLVSVSPREMRPLLSRQFSNLHFLTEDRARTKGKFYGKYASVDSVKMITDIPGYRSALPQSMRDRVVVSAPMHDPSAVRPQDANRRLFTPRPPGKRDPTWQPLTVRALMDYASTRYAPGQGDFRHGQSSRWRTTLPATA